MPTLIVLQKLVRCVCVFAALVYTVLYCIYEYLTTLEARAEGV